MKARIHTAGNLPPRSRCHGPLTISVDMPQQDDQGQPIHLELCRACDTGKEAADALLAWFASGGGHDPARFKAPRALTVRAIAGGSGGASGDQRVSPRQSQNRVPPSPGRGPYTLRPPGL
ncbi:DUF6300 family protein [Streptomyces sp. NPDC088354]|uniref:DUF6300 family protein n=1 Tax=Streptomyces sp. NPDC088354 TaxID=3365856 RepID=UPI00380AF04A